jgi:hypothetical protein
VSRDSAVGIATSCSSPGEVKNFHFSMSSGSGVHPTYYPMGTGGSIPGVKRPGREAGHSPPTSAEVKKMWVYTSTSPIRLHGVVLT